MPKRIPFIDEAYWEKINPYLSQLLTPQNGGINLWTNSTQPGGLNADDVGRTGWNLDVGCLQRWNGSSWENLQPSLSTLAPVITQLFQEWNPSPLPDWLVNSILTTINSWSPAATPPWLTQSLNDLLNTLSLGDIVNLLNQWNPAEGSPVDQLIDIAKTSGGMTEAQAINIIANWNSAFPTWLANYINGRLGSVALSQLAGNATLAQIQTALNQWYVGVLDPYIKGLINIGNLGGAATFEQISGALNTWFNTSLKAYIDTGDANARAYGDQIRATLQAKVDANYADLLNKVNTHGHAGGGTTPAPTQTTTAPPSTTTPPSTTLPPNALYFGSDTTISAAGGIGFIGTGIKSSGSLSMHMWVHDGSHGAQLQVSVIQIPGKVNGVNNIPSNISYTSLMGAQGVKKTDHTLDWSLLSSIGATEIPIEANATSSDYGYNLYFVVNSGTRHELGSTPYKNTVVGFGPLNASTPSIKITYSGPSTDTRG